MPKVRRAGPATVARTAALVVAAIGLVGFALFRSDGGGVSVSGSAKVGRPAPSVVMEDFDGNTVRLSQFEGTPVVMNFWASWCPQCIAEMPDFERVSTDLGEAVTFLGVNQSDSRSAAADLAARTGVTYLLTSDPTGEIFRAFGGSGMPTTVFIAADGSVVDVITGQLTESQLRERIEAALGVT